MEQSTEQREVLTEQLTTTEQTRPAKRKMGRPRKNDVLKLVEAGLLDSTSKKRGIISNVEKQDIEWQLKQMRLICADLLLSFKRNLKNMDMRDQMTLFKSIAPFIGYSTSSQKNEEDIGIDAFAERYVEIEAKIKSVSRMSSSK